MLHTQALDELGEIVTWESPETVSFSAMKDAARDAGLDADKFIREMLPRNAFKRACHQLDENRVIRVVTDVDDTMTFQFTKEYLSAGEFHYATEAFIELDKKTGNCTCTEIPSLGDEATRLVNEQMGKRSASDVTRLVQAIFRQNGDLIPIRRQGGAYFVPKRHETYADAVANFLSAIGGTMRRWEIMAGSKASESAAQSVRDEMERLCKDFRQTCEDITTESSDDVKERRYLRYRELSGKLDAYSDLLAGYAEECRSNLEDAKRDLNAKLFPGEPGDDDSGDDGSTVDPNEPGIGTASALLEAAGEDSSPEAADALLTEVASEPNVPTKDVKAMIADLLAARA